MPSNRYSVIGESSYRIIARKILEHARSAGLGSGDMLPSVRGLALKFDVGKAVVEQAFRYLGDEGLCYAVHGKGTFLAQEPPETAGVSTTIGVVLNYLRYREEDNPFFRSLYEGVAEEAVIKDHNLLSLYNWSEKDPFHKNDELARFSQALNGFIALAVYDDDDCLRLRDTGVPAVAVDYDTEGLGMDCVVIDNRGIMADLCTQVLTKNPEQIFLADISRSKDYDPAIVERREAFQSVLMSKGRKVSPHDLLYFGGSENREKDLKPLLEALEKNDSKVAVVCMDDYVALQVTRGVEKGGFKPGRDFLLAYIGYLRPQYAPLEDIPAFIGAVNFKDLGREGLRLLEKRIEKGPGRAECRRIPGTVIEWKGE